MSPKLLEKLEKRYPVKPAIEADIAQVLEVFNEVWSNKNGMSKSEKKGIIERNKKLYCRRYLQNPYSKEFESIMVSRDGDRIIGFTGTMDFELCYHGTVFPATSTVDQAILPGYQGIGIGFLVLRPHYDRAVIATSGDLNADAQKMHQALGVQEIGSCFVWRRWSRPADVIKRWQEKAFVIEKSSVIDSRFDQLWLTARECYNIIGVRNQAVLKWRYENLPTRDFTIFTLSRRDQLAGYIVTTMERFKRLAPKGILVDFLFGALAPETISKFISFVLRYLTRRGAICVETIVTYSSLIEIFRKLGFYATTENPHFVVYNNDMSRDKPDLWDSRNWHLTHGDSDFYFTR